MKPKINFITLAVESLGKSKAFSVTIADINGHHWELLYTTHE